MQTRILPIDPQSPDPGHIAAAADLLQRRALVAFPTETVYGLGALALDAAAVARIFAAKGRPATNPIIVHVHDVESARSLATDWPPLADRLARAFWPGPLTLVLARSPQVPSIVTAGGPTVAVRMPNHPVALALLRAVGAPLAAPSANASEGVSATRAEHVLKSLDGRIELVLDAGPAAGGLESTVLDLSVAAPRILRPGLINADELRNYIGELADDPQPRDTTASDATPHRSPGMLKRHYAPQARLTLVEDEAAAAQLAARWADEGLRVGWLSREAGTQAASVVRTVMPGDAAGYAAALYHAMHELDALGVDRIVVARPPAGAAWRAIHDRLSRAAAD